MKVEILALCSLDAVAIIAEFIILTNSLKYKGEQGQSVFNMVIRLLISVTAFDFFSWLTTYPKTSFQLLLGQFFNFGVFFLQNVAWWVWLLYVYIFITSYHRKTRRKLFLICSTLPSLLSLVTLVINCFTGILFYFDPVNGYSRGKYHVLNIIYTFMYIIWFIILLIMEFKRTNSEKQKKHVIYLFGFALLPVAGAVLEQLIYGVSLSPTFAFLGVLLVYLNVQQERISQAIEEVNEAKRQLEDSKVKIMLSQIKPHFLFNTLNIIRALCRKNTGVAVEAIDHFSEYLRENMSSLELTYCVNFAEELHHVQNYLYIEKLRFGEMLKIEYDIKVMDFEIPSLALQVCAENAVKHGITATEDGGTLVISTYRDDNFFYVRCADDGAGFDTNAIIGPEHVGVRNTKMRLAAMCNGTLTITSQPGRGTVSLIAIPVSQSNKSHYE